jgi:hypothetical protein
MKLAVRNGHFELAWYLHNERYDDVVPALTKCSIKPRRWEFMSGRTCTTGMNLSWWLENAGFGSEHCRVAGIFYKYM